MEKPAIYCWFNTVKLIHDEKITESLLRRFLISLDVHFELTASSFSASSILLSLGFQDRFNSFGACSTSWSFQRVLFRLLICKFIVIIADLRELISIKREKKKLEVKLSVVSIYTIKCTR